MPDSSDAPRPAVSIILPTYNRAKFLPQAFASIRSQQYTDWELIVVDDGSTDDTRELVAELTRGWPQPVRYVYQENQGAYGARNTGLDFARGQYIAFFDSDDEWLPHHLADCVAALEANPDVDWVYGACRIVDETTGATLAENTFYETGRARPFLRLNRRTAGKLQILDDKRLLEWAIRFGLYCGLQNSVLRRRVFDHDRFTVRRRHECEDRLFVLRALIHGFGIALFDNVHVVYRVHCSNSSASSVVKDPEKFLDIYRNLVQGRLELLGSPTLSRGERRALRHRASAELFWTMGYALLWEKNRRLEALRHYLTAIRLYPWDWRYWKTLVRAVVALVCLPGTRRPREQRSSHSPRSVNVPAPGVTGGRPK